MGTHKTSKSQAKPKRPEKSRKTDPNQRAKSMVDEIARRTEGR
jgi:hypothetical protein